MVSCLLYLEDICNLKKTGQPLATPPLDQVGVSQLHQKPGTLGLYKMGHDLFASLVRGKESL